MSTTITPSLGHGALFTQGGVGASPGFDAIDLRRADLIGVQEGVYGLTDYMVVQRAAGANMSVDIGTPAGAVALVQGDSVSGQGLYTVPAHSSTPINEVVSAANATNPRIDQVVLEVLDSTHDGSGSYLARTRVIAGTPTAGATLDNRNGAATLPGSALRLADILVGAVATSLANTVIRDRRSWARGAFFRGGTPASNPSTASGAFIAASAAAFQCRLECTGVPVRMILQLNGSNSAAGGQVVTSPGVDAVYVGDLGGFQSATGGSYGFAGFVYVFTPAVGSHVFDVGFRQGGGTGTLIASPTNPPTFTVEEMVRPYGPNNAVTSG